MSDICACPQELVSTPTIGAQAPKFGMLIPNRIFVGGITSTTTEGELRQFFSNYGAVKDCKIILDRAGVSKGLGESDELSAKTVRGYGFVTFEQLEDAEKLIAREGEHVLFKDRKLNINRAVRKQQAVSRMYDPIATALAGGLAASPGAFLYAAGGLPYSFQNGLTMYQPSPSGPGLPEGFTLASLPQMNVGANPGYSQMLVAQQPGHLPHLSHSPAGVTLQQQSMAPSYYQPQMAPVTPSPVQWALPASQPHQQWSMLPAGVGMSPYLMAAPSAAGSGLQYYSPLSTDTGSARELVYASPAPVGSQYQTVELSDTRTNDTGVLLESASAGTPVQYVDVQYSQASMSADVAAASALGLSYVPATNETLQRFHTPSQNYGVKRVLAVPRQVICTPPTSYGALYGTGGTVMAPPVKIVAGLGGQRMVTKTVNQNEIQIVPKTQS